MNFEQKINGSVWNSKISHARNLVQTVSKVFERFSDTFKELQNYNCFRNLVKIRLMF